jgi:hypothetical protein
MAGCLPGSLAAVCSGRVSSGKRAENDFAISGAYLHMSGVSGVTKWVRDSALAVVATRANLVLTPQVAIASHARQV